MCVCVYIDERRLSQTYVHINIPTKYVSAYLKSMNGRIDSEKQYTHICISIKLTTSSWYDLT